MNQTRLPIVDELREILSHESARRVYAERIRKPGPPGPRWKAIRAFYRMAEPFILASPRGVWAIDPYEVDWSAVFTPIEFGVWQDIRCVGAVLYPQYPVGRYFVDFGHPGARVAIECDGRAWHQDQERDERRQREIEALGWTVYRIEGWRCLAPDEVHDEEGDTTVPNPKRAALRIREIALGHGLSL